MIWNNIHRHRQAGLDMHKILYNLFLVQVTGRRHMDMINIKLWKMSF